MTREEAIVKATEEFCEKEDAGLMVVKCCAVCGSIKLPQMSRNEYVTRRAAELLASV